VPTPRDFLQTDSGDVDFSRGLRFTPDLQTYVTQKLGRTLSFWEGEWFLNRREGVPLLRLVIGRRFDRSLVEAVLRRACLRTRGVAAVTSLTPVFDNRTRAVSVEFGSVQCVDGTEIPDPGPFILAGFQ
jgi:hypothetical protein